MDTKKQVEIIRITSGEKTAEQDVVVKEHAFTVMINSEIIATLLTTPEKLEYLSAGFLVSEGLIKDLDQIQDIRLSKNGNYATVITEGNFEIPSDFHQKRIISSGCGKGSFFYNPQDKADCSPVQSDIRIAPDQILALMKDFQERSSLFKETGGVHSCAFCRDGKIEIFTEDIGRHNAVDKIFGECLMKKINTGEGIILTSGRISSEIIIKATKREIPIIISRSAPTNLSIGIAEQMNVTLIGFVRGKRMNVYTHGFRVE